jgi:hypothetical protein
MLDEQLLVTQEGLSPWSYSIVYNNNSNNKTKQQAGSDWASHFLHYRYNS